MPTLIRLLVVLVVLAGLGLAGMIALTAMVDPGEREVTVRIPARELVAPAGGIGGPIDLDNLPAPVNVAPRAESAEAPVAGAPDADGVRTVSIPE
jgi:hypothetical protein